MTARGAFTAYNRLGTFSPVFAGYQRLQSLLSAGTRQHADTFFPERSWFRSGNRHQGGKAQRNRSPESVRAGRHRGHGSPGDLSEEVAFGSSLLQPMEVGILSSQGYKPEDGGIPPPSRLTPHHTSSHRILRPWGPRGALTICYHVSSIEKNQCHSQGCESLYR